MIFLEPLSGLVVAYGIIRLLSLFCSPEWKKYKDEHPGKYWM